MPKVHYKIRTGSRAPFIASMLALGSFITLLFIFWPLFVNLFSGGKIDSGERARIAAIFYGILLFAVFLYVVFTGIFASRTLKPSAILAFPIYLFCFFDISGLKFLILSWGSKPSLAYYHEPPVFRGWWIFIAGLLLTILLSESGLFDLAFHRTKNYIFPVLMIWLSTVGWAVYGVAHIIGYELPSYRSGLYSYVDFIYSVMNYLAILLLFISFLVLVTALRKTMVHPEQPPVSNEVNTPPAPIPVATQFGAPAPVVPVVETPAAPAEPVLPPCEPVTPAAADTDPTESDLVLETPSEVSSAVPDLSESTGEPADGSEKKARKRKPAAAPLPAEVPTPAEVDPVSVEITDEPAPEKPKRGRKKKAADAIEA